MASWTKPKTWVDGESVTAAILNTHLRDNLDFLHDKDRIHAVQTQDNALKDGEWEVIRFGGEAFDRGNMHSTRKRDAQVQIRQDGLYYLIFKMAFEDDGAGVGMRSVMLRRNSNQGDSSGHNLGEWRERGVNGETVYVAGETLARMRKGDHVNLFVKQDSGTAGLKALSGTANTAFLQAVQMGG